MHVSQEFITIPVQRTIPIPHVPTCAEMRDELSHDLALLPIRMQIEVSLAIQELTCDSRDEYMKLSCAGLLIALATIIVRQDRERSRL